LLPVAGISKKLSSDATSEIIHILKTGFVDGFGLGLRIPAVNLKIDSVDPWP